MSQRRSSEPDEVSTSSRAREEIFYQGLFPHQLDADRRGFASVQCSNFIFHRTVNLVSDVFTGLRAIGPTEEKLIVVISSG